MSEEDFSKLIVGKKVYCIDSETHCDCPYCEGCDEASLEEKIVCAIDWEEGMVYTVYKEIKNSRPIPYEYNLVFTRKNEALKEFRDYE